MKIKYMILGVSFGWGRRKGLDVFIELSKRLDEKFQIVLIGTDKVVDQMLPNNIISIHRTNDQNELAEIYSAADLFVNPTREDNYPTVNMEAIACGTPVLTFDTGGSPEMVNKDTGVVVPYDDVDALEKAIRNICENNLFLPETCVNDSKRFDKNLKYEEYNKLYEIRHLFS